MANKSALPSDTTKFSINSNNSILHVFFIESRSLKSIKCDGNNVLYFMCILSHCWCYLNCAFKKYFVYIRYI